jgi:hypothetical protein
MFDEILSVARHRLRAPLAAFLRTSAFKQWLMKSAESDALVHYQKKTAGIESTSNSASHSLKHSSSNLEKLATEDECEHAEQ